MAGYGWYGTRLYQDPQGNGGRGDIVEGLLFFSWAAVCGDCTALSLPFPTYSACTLEVCLLSVIVYYCGENRHDLVTKAIKAISSDCARSVGTV